MQTAEHTVLEFNEKSLEFIRRLTTVLDAIAGCAVGVEETFMAEIADQKEHLRRARFGILVAGIFRAGKSTLLNAMVADGMSFSPEYAECGGPMATSPKGTPVTAKVTEIRWGEKISHRVEYRDGRMVDINFGAYSRLSQQSRDEALKLELESIRQFHFECPARVCSGGVVIYDSPGLDAQDDHDDITLKKMRHSDAAIFLFDGRRLGGMNEIDYLRRTKERGLTKLLIAVNHFGDIGAGGDDLRADVWDRLIRPLFGDMPWNPAADLSRYGVYIVNAKQALDGRMHGAPALVEKSGILELERAVFAHLLEKRWAIKAETSLAQALSYVEALRRRVADRMASLRVNRKDFELKLAQVRPQIQMLMDRTQLVPGIIERSKLRAQSEAKLSFGRLINQVIAGLPKRLRDSGVAKIEGDNALARLWDAIRTPFRSNPIAQRASEESKSFIEHSIRLWSESTPDKPGLNADLGPITESLAAELAKHIQSIEKGFRDVRVQLTGIDSEGRADRFNWVERIIVGGCGLLIGGPTVAMAGIHGGVGAAAREVGIVIGAAIVGGVVGTLVGAPLLIAGALVAVATGWNLFTSAEKARERILERVVHTITYGTAADPARDLEATGGLIALKSDPRILTQIDSAIEVFFSTESSRCMKLLDAQVRGEVGKLEDDRKATERDQSVIDADLRGLQDTLETLKALGEELNAMRREVDPCGVN